MRHAFCLRVLLLFCCLAGAARAGAPDVAERSLDGASAALAGGDPVTALRRTLDAAAAISVELPLSIARIELVRERAQGYAAETPRGDARFAAGTPILVYLEPVGYRFDAGGGAVFFGFAVDIALLDEKGAVVARRDDFGSWTFQARRPRLETFIDLAIATDGVPPGRYVLRVTLRDLVDPSARADATLPVAIEAPLPQALSSSPAPSRAAVSSR
jgi:hypothetical protein